MKYTQQLFENGQVLEAQHLNHIEQHLHNISPYIIETFDHFPLDDELQVLIDKYSHKFYFKVIYQITPAHYECLYTVQRNWFPNPKHILTYGSYTYYISPANQPLGEIYLPNYGLIPNSSEYATYNSDILDWVVSHAEFGSILKLPVGAWYFDRPIQLSYFKKHGAISDMQLSLEGVGGVWSGNRDGKYKGTHIFFVNTAAWSKIPVSFNGAETVYAAILVSMGSIKNIQIFGEASNYSIEVDRTLLNTNRTSIFSETKSGNEIIGIYGGATVTLDNVEVNNFYTGVWATTANSFYQNLRFNQCCYGIITHHDVKLQNIYGVDVMTVWKSHGSLTNVYNLRGDSIGKHLVELEHGQGNGLYELDGDFTMGSLIYISPGAQISNLNIVGARGRHSVAHSFTPSAPFDKTTIITEEDTEMCGLLSLGPGATLNGATIITNQSKHANPLDVDSDFKLPYILTTLAPSAMIFNTHIQTTMSDYGTELFICNNNIANGCEIILTTPTTTGKYIKNLNYEAFIPNTNYLQKVNNLSANQYNNVVVASDIGIYETKTKKELQRLQSEEDSKFMYDVDGYIWSCDRFDGSALPAFTNLATYSEDANSIVNFEAESGNLVPNGSYDITHYENTPFFHTEVITLPSNYTELILRIDHLKTNWGKWDETTQQGNRGNLNIIEFYGLQNGNPKVIGINCNQLQKRWVNDNSNNTYTSTVIQHTDEWNYRVELDNMVKILTPNMTIDWLTNFTPTHIVINSMLHEWSSTEKDVEQAKKDLIVTINEEIEYYPAGTYVNKWSSTGIKINPIIPALDNKTVELDTRVRTLENKNTFDNPYVSFYMESPSGTTWSLSVNDQGALEIYEV